MSTIVECVAYLVGSAGEKGGALSEDGFQALTPTFQSRLNHLIASVANEDGTPLTDRQVAQRIQGAGVSVTYQYINLLRSGRKTNPTFKIVQGLADAFGVPPGYFFDDSIYQQSLRDLAQRRAADELDALANAPGAVQLAVKARGLGPHDLAAVMLFVDGLLEAERRRGPQGGRGSQGGHSEPGRALGP
jgi:transcriptional regulator with XRE-family HTH domain